jgi:Spy/CpxP family protein refolding chaperone
MAGLALPLWAQKGPHNCPAGKDSVTCKHFKKGDCPEKKLDDLGLSADQKEKLKTLHTERQTMAKEHREASKAVFDKMKTEYLKPKADRKALVALAAELEKVNRAFAEKRIDHLLKVKAILNQEQFEKIVGREFWGPKGPMMMDKCNDARPPQGKPGHEGCPHHKP